jgi:hypothetical protein
MSHQASTQDEWTIHALNIHGVFFERKCATTVAATPRWRIVSTNYPVEYPPPNGPWRGKESSVDIWARKDIDERQVLDVLIECKKANPEFVNWVFFPKHEGIAPVPFRFSRAINEINPAGSGPWTSKHVLQQGSTTMPVANDAREVRGDYVKHQGSNKTKTSNAAIQDAAYQVALAHRAIVQEDSVLIERARQSGQHPNPPWQTKAYVPLIVTTARLYRVDFAPAATDLRTGEIDLKAAALVPVENLLYEYALPKHLQHSPQDSLAALKGSDTEAFSRMDILVVQAESLSAFLSTLFTE